jgi:hypothetical protein
MGEELKSSLVSCCKPGSAPDLLLNLGLRRFCVLWSGLGLVVNLWIKIQQLGGSEADKGKRETPTDSVPNYG